MYVCVCVRARACVSGLCKPFISLFPSICVCCLAFYGNTLGALFDPRIGHLTSFDLSLGNTCGEHMWEGGSGCEEGRRWGEGYTQTRPQRDLSHRMMERRREGRHDGGFAGVGYLVRWKEGSLVLVCPLTGLHKARLQVIASDA